MTIFKFGDFDEHVMKQVTANMAKVSANMPTLTGTQTYNYLHLGALSTDSWGLKPAFRRDLIFDLSKIVYQFLFKLSTYSQHVRAKTKEKEKKINQCRQRNQCQHRWTLAARKRRRLCSCQAVGPVKPAAWCVRQI